MILESWHEFINLVRNFFARRGYLEVSTPILLRFPNLDTHIEPIPVEVKLRGKPQLRWLQTSPEYSMKKLLSRYKRSVFQVAKVFRNDEVGKLHRIEFHMLEWYRVGGDYTDLIKEIKELLAELFGFKEFEELSVEQAFREFLGVELSHDGEELRKTLERKGIYHQEDEDWETLFYRVFVEVERKLGREKPTFLKDFPPQLCTLAKVRSGYAERFELFIKGVELANGWTEETDPSEVRRRLEEEARKRNLPLDEEFIEAHRDMPPCAGCSIGLDRLFMLWVGKESLSDIELFSDELL
ncbi:MAG: elongation factor P--(R)-beta-lysine ligase [Aquificae bacterium]|nr:elongation factor P--(R)-beta-lysine ligase [Aquificota bacterium]